MSLRNKSLINEVMTVQNRKVLICVGFVGMLLLSSTAFLVSAGAQAPAKETIALTTDGGEGLGIWMRNAAGQNPRLILEIGGDPIPAGLQWSPDGNQLAFHTKLEKNVDIYVVDADGENLEKLTDHEAEDSWPTWHPSGQRMAFQTNRDGNFEIYTMNWRGNILGNLTNDPAKDQYPAWSRNGRLIAFASKRGKSLGDIYVMDGEGENLQNLTDVRGEDIQPTWSWDNNKIAWTSRRSGNDEIWTMDAVEGGNILKISDLQDPKAGGFPNREASWAPDGKHIAAAALGGGQANIRIHPANGNLNWNDLPNIGGQNRSPAWFDPRFVVEFSVSPVGKRALTWGWIKQIAGDD